MGSTCHSLRLLHVNLVAEDDEGEVLRVMRRSLIISSLFKQRTSIFEYTHLNQELVSPAVQSFKALRTVHVVDQDATIRPSVKCYAQRLEPFLSGSVPQLTPSDIFLPDASISHLHGDHAIIDHQFPSQEVGA